MNDIGLKNMRVSKIGKFFISVKAGILSCAILVLVTASTVRMDSQPPDTPLSTNLSAKLISIELVPKAITLWGADASQRFLLMGTFSDGLRRDITSEGQFSASKPGFIVFDKTNKVSPIKDGELFLIAKVKDKKSRSTIKILEAQEKRPFSFPRVIGSLLTKQGCNETACHGSVPGRGGFKLSINSIYPRDDFKWIVKGGKFEVLTEKSEEPKEPRINLENPEKSALLLKPSLQVPHGGGLRFGVDSPQYSTILTWIQAGAPYGEKGESESIRIEKLEVYPKESVLNLEGSQQILVTAHLSNGRKEDVTGQVVYEAKNGTVVEVAEDGLVQAKKRGETSILIRASGKATSVRFGVIASPLSSYPEIPENNLIDKHVFAKLRKFNIIPSELSSDAEFLRRICLDLTGTLPPANRVREFLISRDPNKRKNLIELLLNSPEFQDFLHFRYAEIFRWYGGATQVAKDTNLYGEWLRESIAINKSYDQIAIERIAAQGYDGPSRFYYQLRFIIPPPDMIAEQVRLYLGRRLDCARCHDHPFEAWSQDQFWGMAAFYGRMIDVRENVMVDSLIVDDPEHIGQVIHPKTSKVVEPRVLDGDVLPLDERTDLRMKLAQWIVKHPYFAETFVNRAWDWFFGRGIVDPVDDFRPTNPPTHPKLIKALAKYFRENNHDVKKLMQLIVQSRTYQLSSYPNDTNKGDRINFSHALPKPLDAAVLLDAISHVTGVPEEYINGKQGFPSGTRAITLLPGTPSSFMKLFERNERKALPEGKPEPALSQALHVLTGKTFNEKLTKQGGWLDQILQSDATNKEIIEELYLGSLSRFPSRGELIRLEEMVQKRPRKEALESLTWAIISSRQFLHNN